MNVELDRKRIFTFIGFAFGLVWLTGLVIFLTGGLQNTPGASLGQSAPSARRGE